MRRTTSNSVSASRLPRSLPKFLLTREIMRVVSYDPTTFILNVERAVEGSERKAHDVNSTVQNCYTIKHRNVVDVIRELLIDYCDLGNTTINDEMFDFEKANILGANNVYHTIIKPTSVEKVIEKLQQGNNLVIFHNEQTDTIDLRSIISLSSVGGSDTITDDVILDGSLKFIESPRDSISRVVMVVNPVNRADTSTDDSKWRNVIYEINHIIENPNSRGEAKVREMYNEWVGTSVAENTAGRLLSAGGDNEGEVVFSVPHDYPIRLGVNYNLKSRLYTDIHRQPINYLFRVMRIESLGGYEKRVYGQKTIFGPLGVNYIIIGEYKIGGPEILL